MPLENSFDHYKDTIPWDADKQTKWFKEQHLDQSLKGFLTFGHGMRDTTESVVNGTWRAWVAKATDSQELRGYQLAIYLELNRVIVAQIGYRPDCRVIGWGMPDNQIYISKEQVLALEFFLFEQENSVSSN